MKYLLFVFSPLLLSLFLFLSTYSSATAFSAAPQEGIPDASLGEFCCFHVESSGSPCRRVYAEQLWSIDGLTERYCPITLAEFLGKLQFLISEDGRTFSVMTIRPPSPALLDKVLRDSPAGSGLEEYITHIPIGDIGDGMEGSVGNQSGIVSHDRNRAIFSFANPFHADLFVVSLDGQSNQRLTRNLEASNQFATHPRWTTDDGQIIFEQADAAGESGVYVIDLDDLEIEELTPGASGFEISPDGARIVYSVRSSGEGFSDTGTFIGDLSSSTTIKIADSPSIASWSPDGVSLAFVNGENLIVSGPAEIQPRIVITGGVRSQALWSPDGSTIAFGSNGEMRLVDIRRGGGGSFEKITAALHPESPQIVPLLWSLDGRYLLYRADSVGVYVVDTNRLKTTLLFSVSTETRLSAARLPRSRISVGEVAPDGALGSSGTGSQSRLLDNSRAIGGSWLSWARTTYIGPIPVFVYAIVLLLSLTIFAIPVMVLPLMRRRKQTGDPVASFLSTLFAPTQAPVPQKQPEDEQLKPPHPYKAIDRNRSLIDHDPENTDAELMRHLTSGIAPDGAVSPVRAAIRFNSYPLWLETRQKALDELQRQLQEEGIDFTQSPPEQHDRQIVTLDHSVPIGSGVIGSGPLVLQLLSGRMVNLFSEAHRVDRVTKSTTAFKWSRAKSRWEVLQHYPDAAKRLGVFTK